MRIVSSMSLPCYRPIVLVGGKTPPRPGGRDMRYASPESLSSVESETYNLMDVHISKAGPEMALPLISEEYISNC